MVVALGIEPRLPEGTVLQTAHDPYVTMQPVQASHLLGDLRSPLNDLAGTVGIEPTTTALTVLRSTSELHAKSWSEW